MKKYSVLLVTCISLALSACSSGSSGGGSSRISNLVTNTYSEVTAQAAKASGDAGDALSGSIAIQKKDFVTLAAPSFGAAWETTDVMNNPITNSGLVTVKEFMGIQLDPTAVNNDNSSVNVFGRLNTALGIFCAVGVGAGMMGVAVDSDGYPDNGAHTITFSAAIKAQMSSQCGMDVSDIPDGESMVMTVTTSSGNFAKQFTFNTFNQTYLVKSTATEVNIATGEVHDNGIAVSRTVVFWDKTTDVMRVEYVSDPGTGFTPGQSGIYAYRMYYDETLDEAQIFTYEGPDNNAAAATRYILAGKPSTGDALSLSFKQGNVESGSKLEACVNSSTGSIITDGARCSASSTRLNGDAIDGAVDSVITDFYAGRGDSSWGTVTSSTALSWTNMTNMLSTNVNP